MKNLPGQAKRKGHAMRRTFICSGFAYFRFTLTLFTVHSNSLVLIRACACGWRRCVFGENAKEKGCIYLNLNAAFMMSRNC